MFVAKLKCFLDKESLCLLLKLFRKYIKENAYKVFGIFYGKKYFWAHACMTDVSYKDNNVFHFNFMHFILVSVIFVTEMIIFKSS